MQYIHEYSAKRRIFMCHGAQMVPSTTKYSIKCSVTISPEFGTNSPNSGLVLIERGPVRQCGMYDRLLGDMPRKLEERFMSKLVLKTTLSMEKIEENFKDLSDEAE